MEKQLKPTSIKIKITIEEHKNNFKDGNTYWSETDSYSYKLVDGMTTISRGGFKSMKKLIKDLRKELI